MNIQYWTCNFGFLCFNFLFLTKTMKLKLGNVYSIILIIDAFVLFDNLQFIEIDFDPYKRKK